MKKIIAVLSVLLVVYSCSKDKDKEPTFPNYDKMVNKTWRVVELYSNGVLEPAGANDQHKYLFKTDGKVYFSQINPVYYDTLHFNFVNNDSLKLTKPAASPTRYYGLRIDKLTDTTFDFTARDSEGGDVFVYKMEKE